MIDREKVIRGLQCCTKMWRDCEHCPYKPANCGELYRELVAFLNGAEEGRND